MGGKRRKPRVKIIPDREFHRLWDQAKRYSVSDDYIKAMIGDIGENPCMNYKKYHLDYVEYLDMLRLIYEMSVLTFRGILEQTGKRKSEISHIFCIPIRTVEEWYTGGNSCPVYIRLMLLKHFHLFNLGKYIKLESEVEYFATFPAIYEKRAESENKAPINDDGLFGGYTPYRGLEGAKTERSEADKDFFRKYGFYPDKNIFW